MMTFLEPIACSMFLAFKVRLVYQGLLWEDRGY